MIKRLRQDERGIALVLALGMMVVLAIAVTAVIDYTGSNSRASSLAHQQQSAKGLAEAGLNAAYSVLNYWNTGSNTGNNASDATLLGCNAAGTSCTPVCVSVDVTCPSASSTGIAGTASYNGTYNATTAVWTITGTGYARNPTGAGVVKKTMTATSAVIADPNNPANVAAWNHVYSTAPPGAGCEVDINGQNVYVDVPVYVTGDLCLSGNNVAIIEGSSGQPVDIRVVGKLVLSGSSARVGSDSSHPITSGAVGGGCTTTIGGAGSSCTSGAFRYWVRSSTTLQTLTAPTADPATWYNAADPGPKHACKSSSSPPSLASTVFDNDTTQNNSKTTTFDLTPNSSYVCQSQTGSGQLSWDDANNLLTISGVVFIDGNVTVSQSARYTGKGTIYVGGQFSFTGQTTTLCAVQYCFFSSWNPNTTMLMIVAVGSGTSINMGGNNNVFQGSLFAQPNATIAFSGNNAWIQGPVVGGKFNWGNNVIIQPLPTINTLPPGAPLAVNARATPQPPQITGG